MKIWIIYDEMYKDGLAPKNMLAKAKEAGIDAELFFFKGFDVQVKDNKQLLYYNSHLLRSFPDVCIIRGYNPALRAFMEYKGIKQLNSNKGAFATRDKLESHFLAASIGMDQPKTLHGHYEYENLVKELGCPFVMKHRYGKAGKHIYLINSKEEYESNKKKNRKMDFIYQEYIKEFSGSDIRLFIVGNKIVGAVKRTSSKGDFRSNLAQGGVASVVNDVPEKIKKQALEFASKLDLHFLSVDYLLKGNKYLFCEANANAGFKAFYSCNIDVLAPLMEYLKTLK